MYLDQVADAIRAEVPDEVMPKEGATKLFRLYAVLALAKGADVTAEDVHNAWSTWMADIDPTHDSLVPYDELDDSTRQEDSPFLTAIESVGRTLR